MLIKNKTAGDKGIYTKAGLVNIAPGQTVDVDLADGEKPAPEWFETPGEDDDLSETPPVTELAVKKAPPRKAGKAKADE